MTGDERPGVGRAAAGGRSPTRRRFLGSVAAATGTALAAGTGSARSPDEFAGRTWELTWSDEFEGDSLDASVWTDQTGNGHDYGIPGWGNSESQYYSEDNRWVEDGRLVIEAREETVSDEHGTYDYTSGKLVTAGSVSTRYGRIDVRARLPGGQGIWPAIWMLPEGDSRWPDDGEIDVMELIGNRPDTVHGTVHGPDYYGADGVGGSYRLGSGDFTDGFHVFSIVWEPDRIAWYVDGERYHEVTREYVETDLDSEWVFDDGPFHLILNVAVGGEWPGYPDETTEFPVRMAVDYVRFYEDIESAELPPVDGTVPRDVDGDGRREDLNANGEVDYSDVVTYFENMDDPAMTDHADHYDYNGNGDVDYADLVDLFERV